MSESSSSGPLRIIIRLVLTIGLVWALPVLLPSFLTIQGGLVAIVLIAITLMLLNMIARPLINIVMMPFKLFVTIFAIIIANAAFLWLLILLIGMMDQNVVRFAVTGGLWGWIVVSTVLGLSNWLMKEILK